MKNLTLKQIQRMEPYSPPLEGRRAYAGYLLDFNERTEPYGEVVKNALQDFALDNRFQYYPEYNDTENRVAEYARVKPENVMVTNGSDQAIDLIFRAFTRVKDKVIIPSPSFAMFYQCAEMCGNRIITPVYNNSNGNFPLDKVLNSISKKTKLIVICNPNNPTGHLLELTNIEKILVRAKNSIVMVDEAYYEYTGLSAVNLLEKYPNLIITRTFSKAFGLAALRIGYVVASKEIILELKKIRGPYDINMAAVAAVRGVLSNLEPLYSYLREVMEISKPMVENFFTENGIAFYPTQANFILFKPDNPKNVLEKLKQRGFFLRPRKGFGFDNTLRLTYGTTKQTKEFINMYKQICKID